VKKRIMITVLTLIAGVVFIGSVLAQETVPPGVFSGTITKVDPEKREIVVQNKEGALFFRWDHETRVNGAPGGKEGFISDNLKEGMLITIFYSEMDRHRVASRINVETTNVGTLKGWEFPFGCGLSLC
jgi:hypothetical protein